LNRAFRKGLQPLEQAFMSRTGSVYHSMVKRFSEKRFKSGPRKGKVFRPFIPVPFTLEEFRAWVLQELNGHMNGYGRCFYSGEPLDARTFSVDHWMPIAQGGTLDLSNLRMCSSEQNRIKGKLSPQGYAWLQGILVSEVGKHLTILDAKDIESRLKGGAGFRGKPKKA
jgi:hypothetical protein